ncbi:hypothetical protein MMUR_19590 [Mycolicibacterium murale]|uniref:ATPase AAA n=1 Tax=Mycolicibacterium murale TaxID=182220 RepID=A0A7I9WJK8_9MYCO|nr:hypothetical protein [Mycolicibacterium murale]MCV7181088.1 hypothetical protein [Mycolicibacterium murale]GFG57823.1 hypothetical protein MMUR_19590 [Mycolicibacterium murale]
MSITAAAEAAQALAWQGRGREAEEMLAALDTTTESELLEVALPRAANQFWMLGEPERATAYLRAVRNRINGPAGLTVDALLATFAMNAGAPVRALELAAEVLAAADATDQAVAWAASTSSLCAARVGRFAEVDTFAERAEAAGHPGLLRYTIGLARITTATMTGDLDRAEAVARDLTSDVPPGAAIGSVLLAWVLMRRGEDRAAADLLSPAAPILERTGYSWGPLSLTLLATALARSGERTEAAKALSRAESRHGTKAALFAPELGLARAWRLAAADDPHGAIPAARQAAQTAERSGQLAVAILVWRDALDLGDTRAKAALDRLTAQVAP